MNCDNSTKYLFIILREQNVLSVDETIKEKMDTMLLDKQRIKYDDEKSIRENLMNKDDKRDDNSSQGTLSEQDSINSEEFNNELNESEDISFVDLNQNDITQEVLEMKNLLNQLRTVLQVDDCDGDEKHDTSEKSLIEENKELRNQVLGLQKHLEEKDAKIRKLEKQLKSKILDLNLSSASTQTNI